MTYSFIEEKLNQGKTIILDGGIGAVSYTHIRAHETREDQV